MKTELFKIATFIETATNIQVTKEPEQITISFTYDERSFTVVISALFTLEFYLRNKSDTNVRVSTRINNIRMFEGSIRDTDTEQVVNALIKKAEELQNNALRKETGILYDRYF